MSQLENTIDTATLQTIIENLVTVPSDIKIMRTVDEEGILLSVIVNAKDMGIVIGRSGIMANSIKVIMRAIGKAHKMNVRVEFLEPDGSRRQAHEKNSNEVGYNSELPDFVIN